MFGILRGFLPWILYSICYGSSPDQFMFAIAVALASSVLLDWRELKAGFVLTCCTCAYFLLLLILTLLFHWHWLQKNTWLISNCVLMSIAFGSALIKKPFTLQYAKRMVSKDLWKNPLFLQINYILTMMWGFVFLMTAASNFFYTNDPELNPIAYFILNNIGWVIGTWFTQWFPDYWKNKKFPPHKKR